MIDKLYEGKMRLALAPFYLTIQLFGPSININLNLSSITFHDPLNKILLNFYFGY